MKVIFKKLETLDVLENPTINEEMEHWFDGKTIRTVQNIEAQRGNKDWLHYHGYYINVKWFDEYHDHKDVMDLFSMEI